jgi:hypothetical protein
MATTTKRAPVKPPENADRIPVDPGIETWMNAGQSMVHLIKIGEYGRRETELIYGERVFSLTPQERRINQSQCHDSKNDPFTNGTFKPIALLDDEPDTERLRSNPNVLDDSRIADLFKLTGEPFSQQLVAITNLTAVDRLVEIARQPATGATVGQLEILKRYRKLLAGEPDEPEQPGPEGGTPKPVTPR